MIINFTLENWMSFRGPTSFDMLQSKETHHECRVQNFKSQNLKLLPVAAIFGGNASGKSNFVKALDFARKFIVNGSNGGSIATDPFLLDEMSKEYPTKFQFKLFIGEKIYDYAFAVKKNQVISESLTESYKNVTETIFSFGDNENVISTSVDMNLLELVYKNKKSSQLLLTLINDVLNYEMPVYNWFKDKLKVLFADTTIDNQYFEFESILKTVNNKILKKLDCGVNEIGFIDYFPTEEEARFLESELVEKQIASIPNKQVFAKKNSNNVIAKRFVTYHKSETDELVMFDLNQESDGTVRLFDLLPAFIMISQIDKGSVLVVDELDRSLHTHMIESLVRAYLDGCDHHSNSQLIFTTHNVEIMNLSLLRLDEMRITERDKFGLSTLFSLSEYENVGPLNNIRGSYLIGRFGGIPRMVLIEPQLKMDDEKNWD